ncbi:MAG: DUF1549 domain-containing protein [Verrucomicrobiales bacterium]|nr:DUF1549 domain-containing protein [Verrucomicrobiales bacterium]
MRERSWWAPPRATALAAVWVMGLWAWPILVQAKIPADQLAKLPPPASRTVDFDKDIRPILEASCVKCHGRGKSKGGFQLDTRETFLKDGDSGPAVKLGDSAGSYLIHLVSGLDEDDIMPQKGSRLTAEQVGLLRAWVDQQLPWTAGVTFAREPHRNLKPHRPELPPASDEARRPLDRLVWDYFRRHGVLPGAPVDDRTFARRVFLDVVGLLPSPEELSGFLADGSPDKRERLVSRLLADTPRYSQHWLTFWNDLLRNDYKGTGYIDGGREQVTQWLYASLKNNRRYDEFVRELVSPGEKGPKGFTKGIVWRGTINASQTPQMQAAQNIAQVFLGVNLKCASCHDSFIDDWQLADAYGMAGIYADDKLDMVQCDKPLGKHAPVKFLFPELGGISDDAPKSERIARLAQLMVDPANGRLPRTIVNRLWARFFGAGLVEPIDVMQNPAWSQDLLDWLAEDLVEHGYDLKRTMELILTSRTYQLPAVNLGDGADKSFVFRGPAVRRLTAEQFRDALGQLTGVWYDRPESGLDSLLLEKSAVAAALPAEAYWIWSDPHAAQAVPPQTVYFRKVFTLAEVPSEAFLVAHADNSFRLWVNGRQARKEGDGSWNETSVVDVRPYLVAGTNTLAVEAVNGGSDPNPAGFLGYLRVGPRPKPGASAADRPMADLGTDATWTTSTNRVEGWQKPEFDASGWGMAQVLGSASMEPWQVADTFVSVAMGRSAVGTVRASLVAADPLAVALGRPNREQVTSSRPSTATTIQMLELTNGGTLAKLIQTGASKLVDAAQPAGVLIGGVFSRGLGRSPTEEEAGLTQSLLGDKPAPDAVEDLLWSVAMLPEFQLIY